MKKIIVLVSLVLLITSCNNNPTNSPPVIDNNKLVITDVFPSTALPGTTITITGIGFDSTYYKNEIFFNNTFSITDSIIGNKIFTTVPLNAQTGNIKIITNNDTAKGPIFNVVPVDTNILNIIMYSGETITEQDSYLIDWLGDTVKWKATIKGDTLSLSQGGICGDECNRVTTLKFYSNINDTLPYSVLAIDSVRDFWPDYKIDTLKGFVEIQDWNISNLVCGRIKAYDKAYNYWWSFVFWYKFN